MPNMRMLLHLINKILPPSRFFIIFVLPATGAAATGSTVVDEGTLAQQLKFYKNISEISTTFRQNKHLAEMKLDLQSEGRLAFKRPDDVTWEILKPSPVTVKMSKSDVQITSASGTQVFKFQELSQDNMARGIGMLKPWLTLDAHALTEQYTITKQGDATFLFEPKASASGQAITKISLTLAKAGHLQSLKLFEKSGDWIEIFFTSPKIVSKNP